jgi:hypothetical protein
MKKILVLLFACLLAGVTFAQTQSFRKIPWGSTREEVKNIEKSELVTDQPDKMIYKSNIIDHECNLYYYFSLNNKLMRSAYMFTNDYEDYNSYVDDYDKIKAFLISKYGPAATDKQIWKTLSNFKSERIAWGQALASGDLLFETSWETPTTKIKLYLGMNKNKILFSLGYTSKSMQAEANELRKKEILDNL